MVYDYFYFCCLGVDGYVILVEDDYDFLCDFEVVVEVFVGVVFDK